MAELWCVEVGYHETVIPQPSKVAAEAVAKLWNDEWDRLRANLTFETKQLRCVVKLWPWSEEAHAEELAKHGGMPDDYS